MAVGARGATSLVVQPRVEVANQHPPVHATTPPLHREVSNVSSQMEVERKRPPKQERNNATLRTALKVSGETSAISDI